MEELKALIKKYENDYPELDYLNTQLGIIDMIGKEYPDVAIETCKSIMEATYKFVRKLLDNYDPSLQVEKNSRIETHADEAKTLLQKHIAEIDGKLLQQARNFTKQILEIRNDTGDISHGRLTPKKATNDVIKAETIKRLCEGYAIYLLHETISYKLNIPRKFSKFHTVIIEQPDGTRIQKIDYYDPNAEYDEGDDTKAIANFNQWLDDENPLPNGISYSKALYEQDYIAYFEKYSDNIGDFASNEEAWDMTDVEMDWDGLSAEEQFDALGM